MDEIAILYRDYGIRDYYIIDDIFNIDTARALSVFDAIIAAGLKIRLYFANGLRADRVDKEFIDRAIAAGAIWFTYAIESANPSIQKLVKKKVNLKKAHAAIAYTQQQGVGVNISTMYGFPGETPEQAQETLDWLGTLPKSSLLPYHFCLRLFPGCEIVQQALDAGWNPEVFAISSSCSYNDLPFGTPTFPKSSMHHVILQYHERFGLNNRRAVADSLRTLRTIGYSDREILSMYSLLKRKLIISVEELLG